MKKQVLILLVTGIMLCFAQANSFNVFTVKSNFRIANVIEAQNSVWYDYGHSDGLYDRQNGNPYHTTFNSPTDRTDSKEYQLGYLDGFNGN